jgi:hypothetical protein
MIEAMMTEFKNVNMGSSTAERAGERERATCCEKAVK